MRKLLRDYGILPTVGAPEFRCARGFVNPVGVCLGLDDQVHNPLSAQDARSSHESISHTHALKVVLLRPTEFCLLSSVHDPTANQQSQDHNDNPHDQRSRIHTSLSHRKEQKLFLISALLSHLQQKYTLLDQEGFLQ